MKFRKKPVVIDAWKFDPTRSKPAGFPDEVKINPFICDVYEKGTLVPSGHASIETLEGVMVANPGDWIIRGVKGEVYPCKPDIFEATYEAAE